MYETLVALLAAHLASDFVFQSEWMVGNKSKTWVLALHVAIVGTITGITLGIRSESALLAVAVITGTHLLIDFIKRKIGDSLLSFVLDQLAHIAVAISIAITLPMLAAQGFWSLLPGDAQAHYYALLVLTSGVIAAIPVGGILIKKAIKPFSPAAAPTATPTSPTTPLIGTQPAAPANAGRYIGWLERGLAFAFILMKMPEGVGFLLAAKSVLRIGDLKEQGDRSHAEYIIIGTFMSFGWAFLIAIITQAAANHWMG